MWILLSGEGATDIGRATQDPGPITLGLSQILEYLEGTSINWVSSTALTDLTLTLPWRPRRRFGLFEVPWTYIV